jgi:predicted transcriptional regulator
LKYFQLLCTVQKCAKITYELTWVDMNWHNAFCLVHQNAL